MEGLREKFWKWKEAFESKGLKVNLGNTNKVLVSGAEGEITVSTIDPCGICGKRVMANSVLCVKCGKWIYGRCARGWGETLCVEDARNKLKDLWDRWRSCVKR